MHKAATVFYQACWVSAQRTPSIVAVLRIINPALKARCDDYSRALAVSQKLLLWHGTCMVCAVLSQPERASALRMSYIAHKHATRTRAMLRGQQC